MQSEEPAIEARGDLVFALVGSALAFGAGVWAFLGPDKAEEYYAGYLLEQSLSVDNLFVFILVFKYFKTPRLQQDTVCAVPIFAPQLTSPKRKPIIPSR
jgi:hypothetical protein